MPIAALRPERARPHEEPVASGTSTTREETLRASAALGVTALADVCLVDAVVDGTWTRHLASAPSVSSIPETCLETLRRHPLDFHALPALDAVLDPEAPRLAYTSIRDHGLTAMARSPEHLACLRALKPSAIASVPLCGQASRAPLGAITLIRVGTYRTFEDAELSRLLGIGRLAGLALEGAQRQRPAAARPGRGEDLAALLAHELRTPLHALQLQLELELADPQRDVDLARIHRQVEHLCELTSRMLSTARQQAHWLDLQRQPTDLVPLVRQLADRARAEAEASGCAIELSGAAQAIGRWDPLGLEQVIGNLLSNAIKYGAGQAISISVKTHPHRAMVTVRDHGIGIDPSSLPRLFAPFQRDVDGGRYAGVGLGLYVAREITAAHGGSIHVDTSLERGVAFTVELPV